MEIPLDVAEEAYKALAMQKHPKRDLIDRAIIACTDLKETDPGNEEAYSKLISKFENLYTLASR